MFALRLGPNIKIEIVWLVWIFGRCIRSHIEPHVRTGKKTRRPMSRLTPRHREAFEWQRRRRFSALLLRLGTAPLYAILPPGGSFSLTSHLSLFPVHCCRDGSRLQRAAASFAGTQFQSQGRVIHARYSDVAIQIVSIRT
jgi:hypothetical protein